MESRPPFTPLHNTLVITVFYASQVTFMVQSSGSEKITSVTMSITASESKYV